MRCWHPGRRRFAFGVPYRGTARTAPTLACVTVLDWLIVAFALLLALRGFRQGFIVGLLSIVGFGVGAVVGTRIGRSLLSGGDTSPYDPAFGLVGALVAGAILAAGFEGVGLRMRRALRLPGLGVVDGAFGAVLSAAVARRTR